MLKRHKNGVVVRLKRNTYKTNIPSGDDERSASDGNETQLPCKYDTKDRTTDDSGGGLNNTRDANLKAWARYEV